MGNRRNRIVIADIAVIGHPNPVKLTPISAHRREKPRVNGANLGWLGIGSGKCFEILIDDQGGGMCPAVSEARERTIEGPGDRGDAMPARAKKCAAKGADTSERKIPQRIDADDCRP